MALKDTWKDLIDGESEIVVGDINDIANGVIEIETARESGEFKGEKGDKGDKGESYILTEADKSDIADIVLSSLPNGDEVSY